MMEREGEKESRPVELVSGSIVGVPRLCSFAAFLALMSARICSFEGFPGEAAVSTSPLRSVEVPSWPRVVVEATMGREVAGA